MHRSKHEGGHVNREVAPKATKVRISSEEYDYLLEKFGTHHREERTYVYLDTSDSADTAAMYTHNVRLRIKIKEGGNYLEVKKRQGNDAEVSQPISAEEAHALREHGTFPPGPAKDLLQQLGLDLPVHTTGVVVGTRNKIHVHGTKVGLDKFTHTNDGAVHYEIEIYPDAPLSEKELASLLERMHISSTLERTSKLMTFWSGQ